MKTILVATDFSPAGLNATDYAAQLSRTTGSRLVIFHAWALPALTEGAVVIPSIIADIEKIKDEELLQEAERVEKLWGVRAATGHAMGFANEEILYAAKLHGAGLVVVGMRKHNKAGKILGSVSTELVHENKFPILIIPDKASYHPPKTLLLAINLRTDHDWHEVDAVKELSSELHAGIHVLNVRDTKPAQDADESRAGIRLETQLKNISHSWHFPEDGDIVRAISTTGEKVGADWVVVVRHQLSWLQQLFHKSVTHGLAFAIDKPLLALPEKKVLV